MAGLPATSITSRNRPSDIACTASNSSTRIAVSLALPSGKALVTLRDAADWIDRFRRFWDSSLDRLDAHLGSRPRRR